MMLKMILDYCYLKENCEGPIEPQGGLTPSTLDSCSYRFKMSLIAENMAFHTVKTVFEYSF